MQTSEQISEIATALAKAQGAMTAPSKDRTVRVQTRTGGEYAFSYSTLDAIIGSARKPLSENGIAFVQAPEIRDGVVSVETTLVHSSGQWFRTTLALKPADNGPQSIGSAISYVKRYALSAMLGLVADEDDDGNASEGNAAERKKARKPQTQGIPVTRTDERRPVMQNEEESKASSFTFAEQVLAEAGVVIVAADHPQRSHYLGWMRSCYEQALGREVPKILSLKGSEIRSGATKIAAMIGDDTLQAWRPVEKENTDV